jgi:CDP-glycerol glycerophosphotransferase
LNKISKKVAFLSGKFFQVSIGFIIYNFTKFFPKNTNIWTFGEWEGNGYNDNPKYLFEFISLKKDKIIPVWITKDKKLAEKIRKDGFIAYYQWDIKGILYLIRSKVSVISHNTSDLNQFLVGGALKVQLWHGLAIKKILSDNKKNERYNPSGKLLANLRKIHRVIFPYIDNERYDFIVASSEFSTQQFKSSFKEHVTNKTVFISPIHIRMDVLGETFNSPKDESLLELNRNYRNKILYLPTVRHNYLYTPFTGKDELEKLDKILGIQNDILFIKPHPHDLKIIENVKELTNIKIIFKLNLYEKINLFDALLSDFSSMIIDLLPFRDKIKLLILKSDYNRYCNEETELYEVWHHLYNDTAFESITEALTEMSDKKYMNELERLNSLYFAGINFNNKQALFQELQKLIYN